MYVCMYVCMYVFMYVYSGTQDTFDERHKYAMQLKNDINDMIDDDKESGICGNIYIYIYMYIYTYVNISVCMHVHIFIYIYIYICVYSLICCSVLLVCLSVVVFLFAYLVTHTQSKYQTKGRNNEYIQTITL